MTGEELNLIIETINVLSTQLHYITIGLVWSMVALWIMVVMKLMR